MLSLCLEIEDTCISSTNADCTESVGYKTLQNLEPSTSQVSKPIYKSAIYDWVDRLANDHSLKTRRALEKLETMPTWHRIKRYFPRYDRKAAVEKQKLEAQLKKDNDKELDFDDSKLYFLIESLQKSK